MLPKPESACFVIADISGYTGFLAEVELEHAQDIIADVMDAMVRRLRPRWREAFMNAASCRKACGVMNASAYSPISMPSNSVGISAPLSSSVLPARPAIPISISPMNSSSARARGCRASGRRIAPGYQRKGCCNE